MQGSFDSPHISTTIHNMDNKHSVVWLAVVGVISGIRIKE
jgi:hypothetical protein